MGISRGRLEAIRKPTAIPRISMQTAGIHDFIWRAPCLLLSCLLLWGGNLLEVPVIGADLLQVQGKLDFHRRQSPANAGNQNVDGLPLASQYGQRLRFGKLRWDIGRAYRPSHFYIGCGLGAMAELGLIKSQNHPARPILEFVLSCPE